MNLLWLIDDRNFTPQRESTSVSGLRANMQLTPAVLGQHAPQDILPVVFSALFGPGQVDFYAATGSPPPERLAVYDTGEFFYDGGPGFFTQSATPETQTVAVDMWDAVVREARFDIVDAILGDATARS